MNKPIVIPCRSYQNFITKMLYFQGDPNLKCKEICFNQKTYLLLAHEIPDQIDATFFSSQNHLSYPKLPVTCLNQNICYSFHIKELNQMLLPYEHIASIILSLPYIFTKVAHHHDIYGNELLILHN